MAAVKTTPYIDVEEENKRIAQEYKELLRVSYQTLTPADKKRIRLAFDTAVEAHSGQRRKSGEAYIFHPIEVAKIVASEIGLDATSIVSALLHDVVEDTRYTESDIEKIFGKTVKKIVKGLTKIAFTDSDDTSVQIENFKKVLLTLRDDVRIMIIKIADRLHNMQTIASMPKYKQEKIASETLFIYAPVAHKIGLYNIKSELEDLSLKSIHPEIYQSIKDKIYDSKDKQKAYIKTFSNIISEILDTKKIKYQIKGRPKSIFSIHQKMISKKISFKEVYDKFAIRIIYKCRKADEKIVAWKIYSAITDVFQPNPLRLRDWITSPKSTGYEALHITVMGPKGRWVEIQIRSERMDEIAEKGYAAHFKYKYEQQKDELDNWMQRLQEIFDNGTGNNIDLLQDIKLDLYEEEMFIFTPKGDLKSLPRKASPLDFAFLIHTQVGLNTKACKVNRKLVPLNYELKTGDQVEIITDKNVVPKFIWLEYVKTARAKSSIRSALKDIESIKINSGKEILRRKLLSVKIILDDKVIQNIISYFKLKNKNELFLKIENNEIQNTLLRKYLNNTRESFINTLRGRRIKKIISHKHEYDALVFGSEEKKYDYTLSTCCNPISGDNVFGFTTDSDKVQVHKSDCKNALLLHSNYSYRILSASWISSESEIFETSINLTGVDTKGLINTITIAILEKTNINIKSINFSADANVFKGRIRLSVPNNKTLTDLINKLKKIEGIEKINRL